jgi:hypothetical protein
VSTIIYLFFPFIRISTFFWFSGCFIFFLSPTDHDPRVNIQDGHGKVKAYQVRQVLKEIDEWQRSSNTTAARWKNRGWFQMTRSLIGSSCNYTPQGGIEQSPGRPVSQASGNRSADDGNIGCDEAGVSRRYMPPFLKESIHPNRYCG